MAVHVKKHSTHSYEKSTASAKNCTSIFVQFELFSALDHMMIYLTGRKSAHQDVHKMTKFAKCLQIFQNIQKIARYAAVIFVQNKSKVPDY